MRRVRNVLICMSVLGLAACKPPHVIVVGESFALTTSVLGKPEFSDIGMYTGTRPKGMMGPYSSLGTPSAPVELRSASWKQGDTRWFVWYDMVGGVWRAAEIRKYPADAVF